MCVFTHYLYKFSYGIGTHGIGTHCIGTHCIGKGL